MSGVTPFGTTSTGATVHRLTIGSGELRASILTFGAVLHDVRLDGVDHPLTLGCPNLAAYETELASMGAIVGPVANRIGGARATIEGREYRFDVNMDGGHTSHSGSAGFHLRPWELVDHGPDHAVLTLAARDGEGGFPGNREMRATYRTEGPRLSLVIEAETDAPTLMNTVNHSYWRLSPGPGFAGHALRVAAESYLPGDPPLYMPRPPQPVAGTGYDFRETCALTPGSGPVLNHNLCLSDARTDLRPVTWLTGPTGLSLEMATTEPGLHVYDGRKLDRAEFRDLSDHPLTAYAGLALEAQHWPDAPNNPDFPSILLRPGQPWRQENSWTFARA